MTDEKRTSEGQISDALQIDETKLEDELLRQPSLFFYWSMAWALSARKRRMQKLATRQIEAELTKGFRMEMAAENPGLRVTEKMINDYLAEHPAYHEAQKELIKAEYMEDMLNVAKDAFKEKFNVLLELYRNQSDVQVNEFTTVKAFKDEIKEREKTRKRRTKREVEAPAEEQEAEKEE